MYKDVNQLTILIACSVDTEAQADRLTPRGVASAETKALSRQRYF